MWNYYRWGESGDALKQELFAIVSPRQVSLPELAAERVTLERRQTNDSHHS